MPNQDEYVFQPGALPWQLWAGLKQGAADIMQGIPVGQPAGVPSYLAGYLPKSSEREAWERLWAVPDYAEAARGNWVNQAAQAGATAVPSALLMALTSRATSPAAPRMAEVLARNAAEEARIQNTQLLLRAQQIQDEEARRRVYNAIWNRLEDYERPHYYDWATAHWRNLYETGGIDAVNAEHERLAAAKAAREAEKRLRRTELLPLPLLAAGMTNAPSSVRLNPGGQPAYDTEAELAKSVGGREARSMMRRRYLRAHQTRPEMTDTDWARLMEVGGY